MSTSARRTALIRQAIDVELGGRGEVPDVSAYPRPSRLPK
jgi:hypothetical protein